MFEASGEVPSLFLLQLEKVLGRQGPKSLNFWTPAGGAGGGRKPDGASWRKGVLGRSQGKRVGGDGASARGEWSGESSELGAL